MRVLVTGGSGFIGTNLVEYFSSRRDEVKNFDIVAPRNSTHSSLWHTGDLLDGRALRALMQQFRPEIIFHMAARTDLDGHSVENYAANTVGVENLIAAVEGVTSLQRLIFASSRLVCRIGYAPKDEFDYCPTTPYGESKVIGEKLVRDAISRLPCPALIVRPTSIWGPWFDVPYKTFFLTIARGRYVHPGTEQILKSFGFVGNTIHELEKLMDAPAGAVAGKTFYLADYPPIDVAAMANTIQQLLGVKPIKTVPVEVLRPAAWVGDCLKALGWKNPPLTSFRLDNLLTPMVHDLEPLQAVVGVLPYSIVDGVRTTVDWLRAQGEVS
ncbi:MAG: NAD(P)-dependent oxidoreductase [Sulfuritalea sp.]|nr:NAD(P)-dependent oxidoreductase [Sulfuritalea sp.]